MADTVQITMEKMVPELEDLQARKLFTAQEIKQIVEKRRGFEYALRRVPLRKIDAMRYIEYELKLDALRAARKHRLGLKQVTLGDTSGIKRVHRIFDRVLFKHRGSVELWLQYVAFCKREGSSRVLSSVFGRALQYHPRSAELWIEAVSYEFSVNLHVDAARVLMQRAIRLNKFHPKLWLEYFRLELLYVQKLTMRRQVLRLDENEDKSMEHAAIVRIEELSEEKEATVDDMPSDIAAKVTARKSVLEGAIAKIVYLNAVLAIPDDVAFRLEFVKIRDLFGVPTAHLSDFILQDCLETFPTSEKVHAAKAVRPMLAVRDTTAADRQAVSQAEQQVVQNFETSVTQLPTVSMKKMFAEWMVTRLASSTQTDDMVKSARTKLEDLARGDASLAVLFVDVVHRMEGTSRALGVTRTLCREVYPHVAEMWLLQAQLLLHADSNDTSVDYSIPSKRRRLSTTGAPRDGHRLTAAVSVLTTALTHIAKDDFEAQFALHTRLLHLLIGLGESSNRIDMAFNDALGAQARGSIHWCSLREKYIAWAASAWSLERVRLVYTKFLVDEPLLPTSETYSFLLLCVDIETSATVVNSAQVRNLFEKLVDLFGATHQDAWVQYMRCLSERLGLFADATHIQQRALRIWKESSTLVLSHASNPVAIR
ncbi:hypothetical protein PsorP6_001803 [Peronosclerospora sorghi]|uniref:Uncharacterized protein n=1 Tax=Peronosclerospora sorghi TaxID=230839 RepID=A0ACC0WTF8_9STRA|nr:hypothetical protein PsorP6_001803 [Peronosclerospora sorghi]